MDKKKKIAIIVSASVLVLAIVGCIIFFSINKNSNTEDLISDESSISSEVAQDGEQSEEGSGEQDSNEQEQSNKDVDEPRDENIDISDEELQKALDAIEDIDFNTTVKDNGSTVYVTIDNENVSIVQRYNFKDNLLESIYVDCALPDQESAKEFHDILKESGEIAEELSINGNVVTYKSVAEYKEIGSITKDQLLQSLEEAGIEAH